MSVFDRLKLRNKILVVIIIQTTLLILFGIIGFNISFSSYKRQLYMQTSQIVKLTVDNVDSKLKRINDSSFDIVTNDELQNYLEKINSETSSYQKFQIATNLRTKLLQYSFEEKYIDSIGVVDLDNNQYFEGISNDNIPYRQLEEIAKTPGIDLGRVTWILPGNNDQEILAVRSIRKYKDFSFSKMGLLVVKINKKKLVDSKFDYFSQTGYYFSIFSGDNIILEDKTGLELSPSQFNIQDNEGYFFKYINNKNYLINYSTFDYTGWKFAFALPMQKIMLQISNIQIMIVIIYLIIFLFTTYFVVRFSSKISKPLEKLMTNLKDVKSQWFNSNEYSDYLTNIIFTHSKDKDEIKFLERDFKLLIDRTNSLLKENYEEKIMKKEWQLKALQRQLNPHFLYNTLDSVYWLSKLNNQEQISIIIKSLGNLLRNSIYKSDNIITLGEEIGILMDYINIQKLRFGDRMKINMRIDEELWNIKIPNLTIQTILENSISHAVEAVAEECSIDIFANCDNGNVKITVLDSGPGVESDKLVKLQNMEIESEDSGIGLKNIDQRIKLIFGNTYGLSIDSIAGRWFRVDVVIPGNREVV